MKLPTADFDIEAPDAFAFLGGLMTLQVGVEMTYAREPSLLWAVTSIYVFLAAFVLLLAAITSVDLDRWGRPLAGFAFLTIMVGVGVTYIMIYGSPIQTDTLAFVAEAGEALASGQSPYTVDMSRVTVFPTPQLDGGTVDRFSYPLGAAAATTPFAPFTENPGRLAVIVATGIAGGVIISTAPHRLAGLGLVAMLVGDWATWGVNGLTDALYIAPLVAAMYFWPWARTRRSSLWASAVLFGLATTMKQQPWFAAPFLFIWVWRDRSRKAALSFAGIVAATFFVVNLPALLLTPVATMKGVFAPLLGDGGSLVHLGVGLTSLTLSGTYPIAQSIHTLLMGVVAITYLIAYWRYEALRWTAWVAWVPILFVSYRSLMSYFVPAAVVAVYALICQAERERTGVNSRAPA